MENQLICCDWGTSSLRVRWVERANRQILHETHSDRGIARIYDESSNDPWCTEEARKGTYLKALRPALDSLEKPPGLSDQPIPLVISGMASSSIGMRELPYARIPFNLDGSDAVVEKVIVGSTREQPILLISGLHTEDDVVRGEEVQLIGMLGEIQAQAGNQDVLVVLPGTHSKHVVVQSGRITDFDTFFTGDLFAMLSRQGLLKESVLFPVAPPGSEDWKHFLSGVEYSGKMGLLEALFKVRTNVLLKKLTPAMNFYFLSGLLIGYELRSIRRRSVSRVIFSCQRELHDYYSTAAENLDFECPVYFTPPGQVDQFTVNGQVRLYEIYESEKG